MKKKLLPALLLVVIVFNFIFCSSAYGDLDDVAQSNSRYGGNAEIDSEDVKEQINNGTSSGVTYSLDNFGDSLLGAVIQCVADVINAFPMAIETIITMVTMDDEASSVSGIADLIVDATSVLLIPELHYTIEKTVFNLVGLFNINIFNTESTYTVGTDENNITVAQSESVLLIKENVRNWYYSCRMLAMMINLCVLVYVGIKMAISTVASEEAKYKKMLINWLQSMIVLFLLHYIMLVIIEISEIIENMLYSIEQQMIADGAVSFESTIMTKIYTAITINSGVQLFMYSVFFWVLTYVHLKFFTKYFKRLLTVMFLTIIGPFITVTYPIDKMADNKAQAFNKWTKEYLVNVFIQPIHALIYLVFVFTAGAIAEQAPIVSMMFLLSLGRIENIIKKIFGIDGKSMSDLQQDKVKIPFVGGKK